SPLPRDEAHRLRPWRLRCLRLRGRAGRSALVFSGSLPGAAKAGRVGRLRGIRTILRAWNISRIGAVMSILISEWCQADGLTAFADQFLIEAKQVIDGLDRGAIARIVERIRTAREAGGRLFILGVGGSAANASHAVYDFRKIVGIEAYAPTDNVSELTARTNDEGWDTVFAQWLRGSRLTARDVLLVFSVGGGNVQKNVSANLVAALQYARQVGAGILGVVGR